MGKRNIYLEKADLEKVQNIINSEFSNNYHKTIFVKSEDSCSYSLASPVYARLSSPQFHIAAMDGFAVDYLKTVGASKSNPLVLKPNLDLFPVNTGEPLPEGTDSVIIVEKVNFVDEDSIEITNSSFPWENVRKVGEDIVATEMLFPRYHHVMPQDVGALLAAGVLKVEVIKPPVAVIIPTGSEIIPHYLDEDKIKPGDVIDSSSHMLKSFVEANGGKGIIAENIRDDLDLIASTIEHYAMQDDIDIVITIGGSSAGSKDFTRLAIEKKGVLLVHGVAVMPGKPAVFGSINYKPVFGMPGYPVSSIVIFDTVIKPMLFNYLKKNGYQRESLKVHPVRSIYSRLGAEEFVRVSIGRVEDRYMAAPLSRGAGTITSMTKADGIIRIPSNMEGIGDAETSEAELLRSLEDIDNTILMVGSHDNTIDIITDLLAREGLHLSSTNVGSMGGINAIKKGSTHMAGIHLLDPKTGEYNTSYLMKYLKDINLKRIHLVSRYQGLIVASGNPKDIRGIEDLTRADVKFINRQNGSGTRILTDYECGKKYINTSHINGYNLEEITHMGVSLGIKNGIADTGMGIKAAANAMNLDFIPVVIENYELIVPESFFNTRTMKFLIDSLRSY